VEYENGIAVKVKEKKKVREKEHETNGVLVLLADKEDSIEDALRKYRLREKNEETVKGHKSHSNGDTSKTGEDTFLDGELLVEFLANSMRESMSAKIDSIEGMLAKPNGERDHDSQANMKIERSLLNWLRKKSFVNIMESYSNVDVKKLNDGEHSYKLVKPITKKELMFLEMMGIELK